ncbi:hypothetical protein [Streptomyces sp. NPDC005795]
MTATTAPPSVERGYHLTQETASTASRGAPRTPRTHGRRAAFD